MAVSRLLKRSCAHLSDAEAAAYDAPFPDARFKAGVRRFPNLVPDRPDAPGAALSRLARDWWRDEWRGRSFMAIGAADPVLGEAVMARLQTLVRGTEQQRISQRPRYMLGFDPAGFACDHLGSARWARNEMHGARHSSTDILDLNVRWKPRPHEPGRHKRTSSSAQTHFAHSRR